MPKKRADEKVTVIYLRVSTQQQRTDSQLEDLQRWARSIDGPVLWFTDTYTGRSMKRPGMNDVMQLLHQGKVRQLVVWRLDRLGRSASELLHLFAVLETYDVGLVSLKEGLDLGTPAGRMVAGILASLAEWETEVRAERVAEGIAAAKRQGKKWGGSKKGRRLKVTVEQEDLVAMLLSLGHGVTHIARATGLSRQTVYAILERLPAEED